MKRVQVIGRAVSAVAVLGAVSAGTAWGGLTATALPDGTSWVGGTPIIATVPNPQQASVNHGSIENPTDALAQTFTTGASGFALDKIQIYIAGAPAPRISLHLFQVTSGGIESGDGSGFVNVSGQADLFNPTNDPGTQLTFQFFGSGSQTIMDLDLTAQHEVTLAPNTRYSLELWAEEAVGGSMWWRRYPGSPYPGGNFYTRTINTHGVGGGAYAAPLSGVGQDISRNAIVGDGRDAGMALFAVVPTPFPLQVDFNGGNSGELRPNQAGWKAWDNLPTSGSNNNGQTAENGYPTATTSKSFITSGVASGTVTAQVRSVDINYSSSGNTYINDGQTLDGRDLGSAGSTLSDMYRDFVRADPGATISGGGNTGTNHRLEFQLTGLDPDTPYAITFYAYDNGNPSNIYVFTDVTGNPLAFLPSATSGGTFNPGDGSGGTQYAPDGQYIPNQGGAPPSNPQDRAITVTATSDSSGKLIFAETTVTGIGSALPVLSGFEITQDKRTWTGTTGSWSDPANWTDAKVPNGLGHFANFTSGGASTVTVPGAGVTAGAINFTGSSYTITGGPITLKDSSINSTLSFGNSGRTRITLASGADNQTISAPLTMLRDTTVTVAAAGKTLTLSNLQPSAVNLTKGGPGTLAVSKVDVNALTVVSGPLLILPGGTTASKVTSLTLAPSGVGSRLDLTNNDLIIDYAATATTPKNTIRDHLASGRAGGAWTGVGIISSTAATDAQLRTAIGYAEASELGITTYGGVNFDGTALILKYTWYGDANLNGRVDRDDFALIDRSFAQGVADPDWLDGDFNYDGSITSADYLLIDRAFALQSGGLLDPSLLAGRSAQFGAGYVSQLLASVPEPSTLAAGLLMTLPLTRRHRRSRP